jgi:hypothetical protein
MSWVRNHLFIGVSLFYVFIYGLFIAAVSSSDYIGWLAYNELEMIWKEVVMA